MSTALDDHVAQVYVQWSSPLPRPHQPIHFLLKANEVGPQELAKIRERRALPSDAKDGSRGGHVLSNDDPGSRLHLMHGEGVAARDLPERALHLNSIRAYG